jgi:hypothetical protein
MPKTLAEWKVIILKAIIILAVIGVGVLIGYVISGWF